MNVTAATPAISLMTLFLLMAGCGRIKDPVWYHPDKTLEQAEKDCENCYFEAFMSKPGTVLSPPYEDDRNNPRMYIEMTARQCMKQAGYRRISAAKLKPDVRTKHGIAHSMDYFIAGK